MARRTRAFIALVFAGALFAAPATPAALGAQGPITTTNLGTQVGFARFAVDGAHGHVFVSEPDAGAVAELDSQGRLITTISGLPGAYGMAIGGDYLYVAAENAGSIARIDLAASTPSAQTFVTGLPNPVWLGFAANRLWVGTAPVATGETSVVAIDPSTGAQQTFGGSFYGADFATSPADPNALYMAEAEEEAQPLHRYDISTFPPRETAFDQYSGGGSWGDMAISADGSRIEEAASGSIQELCTQNLQPDDIIYPGTAEAVATSASGLLATGFREYEDPNIAVYNVGVPAPFWTTTTSTSDDLQYGGLALSPDGSTLYAALVGQGSGNEGVVIETYALPPAPSQSVAASCPLPSGGASGGSISGGSSSGSSSSANPPPSGSPGAGTPSASGQRSEQAIAGRLRVRLPRHASRPSAAFLVALALEPQSSGRSGYRYSLNLTGLKCAGGATEIAIGFGKRDVTVPCEAHAKRLLGVVGIASRYIVQVRAMRTRRQRRPAPGPLHLLVLEAQ